MLKVQHILLIRRCMRAPDHWVDERKLWFRRWRHRVRRYQVGEPCWIQGSTPGWFLKILFLGKPKIMCSCWDHSDNFSVEKSLKIFLHQPGPSCDCPSLRAPWGMCRRVYGQRRGPRVSKVWRTAVTYISTFNRHSLFTVYWTIKTHFDPLKYFITRCASTFSDEEQDSLMDTAEKIAMYECFLHLFEQVNQSLLVFDWIQIEDSPMRSHPSFSQCSL